MTWGLLVGAGTGVAANTLAATIVSRWFEMRRGLAMGLLTASAATGQMVFITMCQGICIRVLKAVPTDNRHKAVSTTGRMPKRCMAAAANGPIRPYKAMLKDAYQKLNADH